MPPVSARLSIVKLFLELSLYAPALLVLQGIMAADDQDVEAWYLEGWCFYIMCEQAQENGGTLDELTWEELAKDSRDCLETCRVVCVSRPLFLYPSLTLIQLHTTQDHPDKPVLDHVKELITKLEAQGITPSPAEDEEGEWEDAESEGEEEDVEMH